VRAGVRQSVLLLAGVLAGVWIAVSPWVIGYPRSGSGWTSSQWSDVVAGAVVAAASGAGLVLVATHTLAEVARHLEAARARAGDAPPDRPEPEPRR